MFHCLNIDFCLANEQAVQQAIKRTMSSYCHVNIWLNTTTCMYLAAVDRPTHVRDIRTCWHLSRLIHMTHGYDDCAHEAVFLNPQHCNSSYSRE